ncbi:MFS transporter [Streptomyces sp. NPDC056910]|uniref:MFS transporter n=1 Tax=Streptomyces sp. NPDC056910 TaxID=3345964 RepID=UPI0036C05BA3
MPIADAVHVSVGRTAVLVSALYLASAIAQSTGGMLAQKFGPRRVFLTGVSIVLAGGIVGGTGQNLTTLVLARVLIGVGTAPPSTPPRCCSCDAGPRSPGWKRLPAACSQGL